jgi:hypothetical protein
MLGLPGSLALQCAAFCKCCAMQCQTLRETNYNASFGTLYDFKADPQILTRVSSANPSLMAARPSLYLVLDRSYVFICAVSTTPTCTLSLA